MSADPKTAELICLEGVHAGNRFYSRNCPENGDQSKLADGTVAYRILGYANTSEEALDIIEGGNPAAYVESCRRAREIEDQETWGDNRPPELARFREIEQDMIAEEVAKRQMVKALAESGIEIRIQSDELPSETDGCKRTIPENLKIRVQPEIETDGYKRTMPESLKSQTEVPCLASMVQKLNSPIARIGLSMLTKKVKKSLDNS
jgi:hypothetical protein